MNQPSIAAFPKCYMDELCIHKTMTVPQWIELASTLGVDGLEFYAGFMETNPAWIADIRARLDAHGLQMPMLCCSPDFTSDNIDAEIAKEIEWIKLTSAFDGKYCRVLSGQRRPDLTTEQGLDRVAGAIEACLKAADDYDITLILENHYKDNYWTYPEWAQSSERIAALIARIDHPRFMINYDPSNAFLAGEDPLDVLDVVKHRVITMHASDRTLLYGTIEDLRNEENDAIGYASRLSHGEIGKGLNDYDAIFTTLKAAGRTPDWVSIEDGMNGIDELKRSVDFVRRKVQQHFPA
jgi:sugar phosphate isomerase/epimerase